MSADKNYCMSSYLALRYIEDDNKEFAEGLHHRKIKPVPDSERIGVYSSDDIDRQIHRAFDALSGEKLGICLSGGMDSAILASYMRGCDAYTFRFLNGEYQKDELERAAYYAKLFGLQLHYVEIDWHIVEKNIDTVMEAKAAPVHSIEPQILEAALQAKADGVERMIIGESSDLIFGGMDQLLSKDWTLEAFKNRYIFTNPEQVLQDSEDMGYVFERYRKGEGIDFLRFMDDVFSIESSGSYLNAFEVAEMSYTDPYAKLKMAKKLDLYRIRHGESKYLIRELFAKKYPEIPVPNKTPMPRPVDAYFKDWQGPTRPEFKKDLNMSRFTGDQKWQMWCLERFLNLLDQAPEKMRGGG